MIFRRYRDLSAHGVMGMNRRNVVYIGRYNPRSLFPLVDDKLKTKTLAVENGVTVPRLLGVVERQHDVRNIAKLVSQESAFCIKPVKGSGGKGILVIARSQDGKYYKTNGQSLDVSELQRHVSNILAGLFSLGGATDVAMVESCIRVDGSLSNYSYEGAPDIRVIVFQGIPVMAMMRLSCSESNGKANLHQGAIGVGLDMASGTAVNAVQNDNRIDTHPDTQQRLADLCLPQWRRLLSLACACYDMTGLGYLGVDLVMDEQHGPMLLELNARPGLSIQIANNQGLIPHLQKIEAIRHPERWPIEQRVSYAQTHFGVSTPLESASEGE